MNNELIERIDSMLMPFRYAVTPQVRTLLLDCEAEIEHLTLANETLSALNVEYLERVKLLETEAWRESKAIEAKPVGETVKVEYYLPEYRKWTAYLSDVAVYEKTFGTPEGGFKKRTLYTAPPSIDALIGEIKGIPKSVLPNGKIVLIIEQHKLDFILDKWSTK